MTDRFAEVNSNMDERFRQADAKTDKLSARLDSLNGTLMTMHQFLVNHIERKRTKGWQVAGVAVAAAALTATIVRLSVSV